MATDRHHGMRTRQTSGIGLAHRAAMLTNRPCVMVVDDEEDIVASFAFALETAGYNVVTASDGLEALDKLKAGPRPDVILLDFMMPRANGQFFRDKQRTDPTIASIPVVLVTASSPIDPLVRSLGVRHALQKPVSFSDLLQTLKDALAVPA